MIKEANWDLGKCCWSKCGKEIPSSNCVVQMWSVYDVAGSYCSKKCAVKAELYNQLEGAK